MELIIIKSGDDYIRVKNDSYFCVPLDKASVFPMDALDQARLHLTNLNAEGFEKVVLKRLILTEEDL